jgi:hypothetical protein
LGGDWPGRAFIIHRPPSKPMAMSPAMMAPLRFVIFGVRRGGGPKEGG